MNSSSNVCSLNLTSCPCVDTHVDVTHGYILVETWRCVFIALRSQLYIYIRVHCTSCEGS